MIARSTNCRLLTLVKLRSSKRPKKVEQRFGVRAHGLRLLLARLMVIPQTNFKGRDQREKVVSYVSNKAFPGANFRHERRRRYRKRIPECSRRCR